MDLEKLKSDPVSVVADIKICMFAGLHNIVVCTEALLVSVTCCKVDGDLAEFYL